MSLLKPTSVAAPDTLENDPRIGHLLGQEIEEDSEPRAVLLGFPSDKGVQINGGRPGASEAPKAIREQLYSLTPSGEYYDPFVNFLRRCKDLGNIEVRGELKEDQENLGEIIADCLQRNIIPIVIGGGHETAFGHFLGYAESGLAASIFNLDAHADVRPLKNGQSHSGSPFREALEHESRCADTYLLAGVQPHSIARAHLEFITKNGGHHLFRDETNITSISGLFHNHDSDRLMVTFDIDAVDQSQAPGVSAPCTNGLPADLWLTAAYLAGRNEQVTSFDISEMNPLHDRDNQTAKLAALTIWHFILGVSQRD